MRGTIVAADIGKQFRKIDRSRPPTLRGLVISRGAGTRREQFWALRHVNFTVPAGRAVGVVGRNGAGKSTLMRIIGGVTRPNEGTVRVDGRIGALLEIGSGLSDELTGRENVFVLGVIAGMLRAEVREKLDRIVEFAELAEFIDRPVRTYSTGMKMRLAFAVAVHVEPDLLLIDEVLAVGDAAFQAKCFERIEALKAAGCTIFLVSHAEDQIRSICDDVLFLKDGRVIAYGPTEETLALFESSMQAAMPTAGGAGVSATPPNAASGFERVGSRETEITQVDLLSVDGQPVAAIRSGSGLRVQLSYRSEHVVENVVALVAISTSDGTACLEVSSVEAELLLTSRSVEQTLEVAFERLDLVQGTYYLTVGLFSQDWHRVHDYHAEAYTFNVDGETMSKGYLRPRLSWRTP